MINLRLFRGSEFEITKKGKRFKLYPYIILLLTIMLIIDPLISIYFANITGKLNKNLYVIYTNYNNYSKNKYFIKKVFYMFNDLILKFNKVKRNSYDKSINIEKTKKFYNLFNSKNRTIERIDKNFEKLLYQNLTQKDEKLIKEYSGGDLGSEWLWIKNISIVYTWVDGSDINFIEQKAKYEHGYRNNNNRYRSVDELRYSLRSIVKFIPWHEGKIYIVTNQQVPSWLNINHPRVKIIDHKQIIPNHIRPTFNSNIIELFLDRIPGLTERFIYFNDDVFLNNYVHPAFFFTSKTFYPKVYKNRSKLNVSKEEIEQYIHLNTNMFKTMNYNTRKYIQEYFDPKFQFFSLCHTPFPLYRDLFEPYRNLFVNEWHKESAYRFRSHYNFQVIYLYYAFLEYATNHKDFPYRLGGEGKAKFFEGKALHSDRSIQNYSVKVYSGNISNKYIIYGKVTNDSAFNSQKFSNIKNRKEVLIYNINDEYSKKKIMYELIEFLIEQYQEPSIFEKPVYRELEEEVKNKLLFTKSFSKNIIEEISNPGNKYQIDTFNEIIKNYKYSILKKYFKKKEKLNKSRQYLSYREKKEIEILLKYNGNELEDEWNWAKNITFVYYFENSINKLSRINSLMLKYSLFSIHKYLPWHSGNIYIITEKPLKKQFSWLKLCSNQSKIKIFSQSDVIPKKIYQFLSNSVNINKINSSKTNFFNRNLVERYLDKLPNISERFIYLKPNFFFLKYTPPQFFFDKEGSPKYYFGSPLSKEKENQIQLSDKSLYNTYKLIRKYFGEYYIESIRYLEEAPFTCYRDLFDPVRQLYKNELEENNSKDYSKNILFPYLISTYNVYGTDHPFYPDLVVGFGKIKNLNIEKPNLNENRTLTYYGYDITSPMISKTTILNVNNYSNSKFENEIFKLNILNTKKNFFTLNFDSKQNLKNETIDELCNFFNKLYDI